nr:FxsC protein [Micromonospora sp. DSM 115978]
MPNFFLSSAAGDDDHYVEQFHHDLCSRVAELSGAHESDVGFLGTVRADDRTWPDGMATALSRCDAFIALWSPRYFLNDNCGRQYWAFNERIRRQGAPAPALIPLMWTPTTTLTGASPAYVRPDDGAARRGLRRYVRLRGLREPYDAFVTRLATRLVAAAGPDLPSPDFTVAALLDTPSAFAVADLRPTPPPGRTGPPMTIAAGDGPTPGAHHVCFVVAAGSREEMRRVREDTSTYGEASRDWAPYRPSLATPLAEQARALAAEHLVGSEVADVAEVLDRIEVADRRNEIVVLLVDPWTTRLGPYRDILAEADRRGLGSAAVLVAVDRADAETYRHADELGFGVRQVFRRSSGRSTGWFRSRVDTPETFAADLTTVLEQARNRVFGEGRVHHRPPEGSARDRPILRGP